MKVEETCSSSPRMVTRDANCALPHLPPLHPASHPQPTLCSCPAKPCYPRLHWTCRSAFKSKTLIPEHWVLEYCHSVQEAYSGGSQLKSESFTSIKCMILLAFKLAFYPPPFQKKIWVIFVNLHAWSFSEDAELMCSYGAVDINLSYVGGNGAARRQTIYTPVCSILWRKSEFLVNGSQPGQVPSHNYIFENPH